MLPFYILVCVTAQYTSGLNAEVWLLRHISFAGRRETSRRHIHPEAGRYEGKSHKVLRNVPTLMKQS